MRQRCRGAATARFTRATTGRARRRHGPRREVPAPALGTLRSAPLASWRPRGRGPASCGPRRRAPRCSSGCQGEIGQRAQARGTWRGKGFGMTGPRRRPPRCSSGRVHRDRGEHVRARGRERERHGRRRLWPAWGAPAPPPLDAQRSPASSTAARSPRATPIPSPKPPRPARSRSAAPVPPPNKRHLQVRHLVDGRALALCVQLDVFLVVGQQLRQVRHQVAVPGDDGPGDTHT